MNVDKWMQGELVWIRSLYVSMRSTSRLKGPLGGTTKTRPDRPVSAAISLNVMCEALRLCGVTVRRPAYRVDWLLVACICTSLKA